MKVYNEAIDSVLVLRPVGRLDAVGADVFSDTVVATLADEPQKTVVDLTSVAFVSSAGLRALIDLSKRVSQCGRLAVCGLNPNVRQVFELVGFDRIMTLCDDLAAARSALS